MNALIKEFNSSADPDIKSYASLYPKTEGHNADDSFSVKLFIWFRQYHMKEDSNFYFIWRV